jgi:hypothetical protein
MALNAQVINIRAEYQFAYNLMNCTKTDLKPAVFNRWVAMTFTLERDVTSFDSRRR